MLSEIGDNGEKTKTEGTLITNIQKCYNGYSKDSFHLLLPDLSVSQPKNKVFYKKLERHVNQKEVRYVSTTHHASATNTKKKHAIKEYLQSFHRFNLHSIFINKLFSSKATQRERGEENEVVSTFVSF